jgi:predicted PurR-regulated permease PerM
MNRQTWSIIFMIVNFIIVSIMFMYIWANIILKLFLALVIFYVLYKVEFYLLDRNIVFRKKKVIRKKETIWSSEKNE